MRYRIASILIALTVWKIVIFFSPVSVFLPAPEDILKTFWSEIFSGNLLTHVMISSYRVFLGCGIASIIAIPLGLAMGWFGKIRLFFEGLLEVIRPIPPLAWLPLSILWFGIGEVSKIYIIFLGAFFPILINTISGVKSIDENLLKLAKSMHLKGFNVLKEVVFPGALPFIFTGLRIGFGVGWMCLVAAELIAAQSGLGYLIEESKELLLISKVIMVMLVIGALGLLFDIIILNVYKIVVRWR